MQDALKYIQNELCDIYPESEIKFIGYLLIEKLTGLSHTQVLSNKNTTFSTEQRNELTCFVKKLKKNTPIQYILGETEFYGLRFNLNESVLIPRPETEELIEWICTDSGSNSYLHILDIGTGSGCIACALKNELKDSIVDAFDISDEALKTARSNAEKNNLQINFTQEDILNPSGIYGKWDIIVSNPPYIPEKQKEGMNANVLEYEPHLALFVPDNDPLLFYRKIGEFALKHLTENGTLYFEIHYDGGQSTVNLLQELGFRHIELRKDMAGNDRMIRCKLSK